MYCYEYWVDNVVATGYPAHTPIIFSQMENRIINAWTAQKAGMDMIDKEAISKKVEEATRGTVKSVYE